LTLKAGVRLGVCPFLLFTRDIFYINRFRFGGEKIFFGVGNGFFELRVLNKFHLALDGR